MDFLFSHYDLSYVVAFSSACLSAFLFIVIKKFPHTSGFIFSTKYFYFFLFYYGVIGAFLNFLVQIRVLNFQVLSVDNEYLKALLIGLLTFSISQINFERKVQDRKVKLGVNSLTFNLNEWLVEQLELSHYYRMERFIKPTLRNLSDTPFDDVKDKIKNSIPYKKLTLIAEIDDKPTLKSVLIFYLENFGRDAFETTFK